MRQAEQEHAKVKLGTGGNKPISQNLISCELKGRKSKGKSKKRAKGGKWRRRAAALSRFVMADKHGRKGCRQKGADQMKEQTWRKRLEEKK